MNLNSRTEHDTRSRPQPLAVMRRATTLIAAVAIIGLSLTQTAPVSAQILPSAEPTIVVVGSGEASAPAETARIQFLVNTSDPFGGPMGGSFPEMDEPEPGDVDAVPEAPSDNSTLLEGTPASELDDAGSEMGDFGAASAGMGQITIDDLEPMVAALVDGSIARDDIFVNANPGASWMFGPGGAIIELVVTGPGVEDANELVTAAIEAAQEANLFVSHAGLDYNLSDCSALLREARMAAIADGRTQAAEMAELLEVTLGDVMQVYDYGFFGTPSAAGEGCPPAPTNFFGPSDVIDTAPFDPGAEPVAEAYAQLNMAFAYEQAQA